MNRIERLEKILNKTSGNPYHDNEGKFTFSPSSFKNTSGKDAEVTDNPRDWYLTDLSRKNINKVSEISSTKELKDYLSSNGISSDIDNPAIKKYEDYENIKFDALQKQASGIVASVEFCKAVFGKESLSKLKEIKFYSSEAETTGSFDVMLKGEKPSKTNGTMELSTNITNRGILHEFIHVVQDSTKKKSQDSVLWSKEILDKTGVNSKAYAGANKNHLAAEQLADLISFGIADGKNLEDVSKVINYIRKNKTENSIQFNGGKGSGNFNPGQGRGVGKPSKHSINTDISKSGLTHKSGEATAGYTGTTSASIINDLLRQGLDTKDYQSVIDRLDSNMEEIKVDTLLKRGVSFNFLKANSEAFGITEDMGYKEVQKNIIGKSFKELGYSSATYGDESDYGSIHLKIKCPKGTKAIWTGNDKEKEVIISRGTTFKVNDYRRENENDPWSKIIVDLEVISQDNLNKKNNMITNGGPGSGNPNPGQGRGIGKPNNGSSKTISTMNYDKMVEDGSEKWRDVALNLSIQLLDKIEKNHPELIDKEKQERNLENNYKEYERWQDKGDRVHNLSYDEYKEKVISKEIDSDGFKFSDYHPMHTLALYGAGASPFLEGLTMFAMGANIYFDKRKEFDTKHKISETIDKNKDLWTSYNKPLYRGVSTAQERIDNLKKGSAVSMNGLSSWSSKKDVADRFTKTSIFKRGNIPLVFIDKTKKHDKTMFYPFSSAMGFNTQYEYVQSGSNKYKVVDVYKEGDVYYAEVESY